MLTCALCMAYAQLLACLYVPTLSTLYRSEFSVFRSYDKRNIISCWTYDLRLAIQWEREYKQRKSKQVTFDIILIRNIATFHKANVTTSMPSLHNFLISGRNSFRYHAVHCFVDDPIIVKNNRLISSSSNCNIYIIVIEMYWIWR